jgi:hypothetical protein
MCTPENMKNSFNSKIGFAALAMVFIFGAIFAMPTDARADYGYGGSYNYSNPYGSYIGNQYGYNRSSYVAPVVIQQPIYVQQPVYIQQPVVVQQPVIVQQPVVVQQPVYIQQPVYNPLTVSCSAIQNYNSSYPNNSNNSGYYNNTNNNGTSVTWRAYASGGNGYYTYSWSGTDGLYGSSNSIYFNYTYPGVKYATVTVYSNGQSITQSCSAPVNISQNYPTTYQPVVVQQPVYVQRPVVVQQPVYQIAYTNGNSNTLNIGCYADPMNAKINQPITWNAEVTGGVAPYTYSWTGSDNLNGTQSSVVKYYSMTGSKSAIVTVTSADGRTGVKACSNALTVTNAYKAPVKTIVKAPIVTAAPIVATPAPVNTNLSANSLFSLDNIPWGWVAILIIFVLFFTVMYLLFNKKKI